ncbi:hypothetical protein ACFSTA_10050 [Ornithinibacillus salinisoli]|uniref:Uncharacterized protein n=1 Tax=Ornithinibacillus salinisoli TaxID=1848459 RepID=A0ABW4VX62_9BACI
MATRTRRWILKVKKTIRRQTWRERIISSGQKDPLVCPYFDNYYEYKGEVCLENGRLEIKITLTKEARNYLERVSHYRTEQQTTQKRKEEKRNRPPTTEGRHKSTIIV